MSCHRNCYSPVDAVSKPNGMPGIPLCIDRSNSKYCCTVYCYVYCLHVHQFFILFQSTDDNANPRIPSSRRGADEPHIGKYRLIKTIGKGNFAKVKLAKHVPTGREVSPLFVFLYNKVKLLMSDPVFNCERLYFLELCTCLCNISILVFSGGYQDHRQNSNASFQSSKGK